VKRFEKGELEAWKGRNWFNVMEMKGLKGQQHEASKEIKTK
jgi:hypothetical protein